MKKKVSVRCSMNFILKTTTQQQPYLLAVRVCKESLLEDGPRPVDVVAQPLLLRRHEPQHLRTGTVSHGLLQHLRSTTVTATATIREKKLKNGMQ